MKVPFASIRMHFPDTDSVGREELDQWIGYPENVNNPNFYNTCAIRLSLARKEMCDYPMDVKQMRDCHVSS